MIFKIQIVTEYECKVFNTKQEAYDAGYDISRGNKEFAGPFNDGNFIRYETWPVYNMLSK